MTNKLAGRGEPASIGAETGGLQGGKLLRSEMNGQRRMEDAITDMCESCNLHPATEETDDMVKLCQICWAEAAKESASSDAVSGQTGTPRDVDAKTEPNAQMTEARSLKEKP